MPWQKAKTNRAALRIAVTERSHKSPSEARGNPIGPPEANEQLAQPERPQRGLFCCVAYHVDPTWTSPFLGSRTGDTSLSNHRGSIAPGSVWI
nr:uncharacterized protein LOC115268502 isoform X2 [Aedes albopictus]XP_029732414.1 uncharacterized protein LOC109415089 isoform X2 [Aedes albopictus]